MTRDFRLFWLGQTTSRFGGAVTTVALPLAAITVLQASTFQVAMLAAAVWLPWLLAGLPAGVLVDRSRSRRHILIASDLVAAALFVSVPVAAWLGVLTIAHLLVVALLTGLVSVFVETAGQVYLAELLPAERLAAGNARLVGADSAAKVAGPGVGGLIAQVFGAVAGLLVDALTFVISAACMIAVRHREPATPQRTAPALAGTPGGASTPAHGGATPPGGTTAHDAATTGGGTAHSGTTPTDEATSHDGTAPGDEATAHSGMAAIAEGLRFVVRDPLLRVMTVYGAAANLALNGYSAIQMLFLVRENGADPGVAGLLIAIISAGGVAGAAVAGPLGRRFGTARTMLAVLVLTAPFALLVPLARPGAGLAPAVVGGLVLTTGLVANNVLKGAFRQAYVPRRLLGRVINSMQLLNYGAIPVGALIGGALGTALGLRPTMWIMAASIVAATGLLFIGPLKHLRDLPTAPAASPAGGRTTTDEQAIGDERASTDEQTTGRPANATEQNATERDDRLTAV
ncbi:MULTISPECIES: MFS transporter [Catenuloplanes]|uniref:MFS family permease n=1 Tax=Catenuloplanes niger TaxID=587534 RepID=A0AAE3ZKF9_9ACTN|nr:MFS transporter [Catenuloplanes niger]MDR7321589.1 MFS family permease [Catenuloplanes niger]